jgi:BirA family biotin operon repressor/biotin-[acetyl-CoA-carboxylase] ligase
MFAGEEASFQFSGEYIGRETVFFDSLPSTNDMAFELAGQRADPDGLVVVADAQTRGKGRQGRSWISPPGVNLYCTILLRPPLSPDKISIFSLAAPSAAVTAIRTLTGLPAVIKWPNDIQISGRKTGGILIEIKLSGNAWSVAVGTGINVNMPLDALPPEIRPLSTSLKTEKGEPVQRGRLLEEVLREMDKSYKFLLNGNKRAIIQEWIRLNSTIGRKVSVKTPGKVITGLACDINERGELLVRLSSGEIETVRAGDVTLLKGR